MSSEDLSRAVEALRAGLVVGVPTDTVYGIAADPFSAVGVRGLFEAKGRPAVKPVQILASDLAAAGRVGRIEGVAAAAAARYWPGPLTLVVPRIAGLPDWVGDAQRGSVGIRVPDHPVTGALLEQACLLAATSANRSGDPPAADDLAARHALGDAVAVYLPGAGGAGEASTVVDLTGSEPRVLREGPIPWPADRS